MAINFKLKVKTGLAAPATGVLDVGELGYNKIDKQLYIGNGLGEDVASGIAMVGHLHTWADSGLQVLPGNTGFTLTPGIGANANKLTLSGTLVATHGGTGITNYAVGDILYTAESNTLSKLGIGSTGQILTVAANSVPIWADAPAGYTGWSFRALDEAGVSIGSSTISSGGVANIKESPLIDLDVSSNTIIINHAAVTRTDPSALTDSLTSADTFTVVTGTTTDASGHVTAVQTTEFTLPDSDNYESFILKANTDTGVDVTSDSVVDIVGSSNVTVTRDGSTNKLTLASTDTLNTVATRGASTDKAISITNTTETTSNSTGALIVDGGIAVKKNARIDGVTYTGTLVVNGDESSSGTDVELVGTYVTGTTGPKKATIVAPETLYLDPAATGANSGTVVILGNLDVQGTTTTINATDITIDGLDIVVANGTTDPALAAGAGILVGNEDIEDALAAFTFNPTQNSWLSSINLQTAGDLLLNGSTSGTLTIKAPVASEGIIINMPSATGTLALTSELPHAMTSNRHTAGNWKLFYSNGNQSVVELGLGASGKVLKSNGTEAAPSWEDDIDTTYSVFTGATSSANGTTGLVPQPLTATDDDNKFLKGDGTWATPVGTDTFLGLTDTPSIYPTDANTNKYFTVVNSISNALEFVKELDCGTYAS